MYKQKSCMSKEVANNEVLLEKKHHCCVLEGTLKSMLIASLERVYKVNVPEKCLADRCSESQEAVAFSATYWYCLDETRRGFLLTELEEKVSPTVFSACNLILNLVIFFFPLKSLSLGVLQMYQHQGFHFFQGRSLQLSCFMEEIFKIWPRSSRIPPRNKQTPTTYQVKPNKYLHLATLKLYTYTFKSS